MATNKKNSIHKWYLSAVSVFAATTVLYVSSAEAAILTLIDDNGNSTTVSSCCGSAINFDIDFVNFGPVLWDVEVESADIGNLISLEGSFGNSTGTPWNSFLLQLAGGPTWDQVNRIHPADDFGYGQVSSFVVTPDGTGVSILFDPAIFPGFIQVGDPGNTDPGDTEDWFLLIPDTLSAGDHFQLSLEPAVVPVPAAVWLFGSGLIGLIGVARRRTVLAR